MPDNPTFEDNIKKLEEIVRRLERGEITLEEGLGAFEEGVALIRQCQKQLDQATHRIQAITQEGIFKELKQDSSEG